MREVTSSLVVFYACAIGVACSAESSSERMKNTVYSGNHRPVIREAAIVPSPVILNAPLFVDIHAEDSDRDVLVFHHHWIVNGQPLAGQTGPTLPATLLKRGDMVNVEIIPDDGKERGDVYRTATVPVINTPPIISAVDVRLSRDNAADKLEALVEVSDPDQDSIEVSYRWWKNNQVVQESGDPFLDVTDFSPEDVVIVEATAQDLGAMGRPVKSAPLVLGNRPPIIISIPPPPIHGDRYEYRVKARDSEGDPLRFKLDLAPPGMAIETETGYLTWEKADRTIKGTHKVRVVAEDSRGGRAFQEFEVTLANSSALQ